MARPSRAVSSKGAAPAPDGGPTMEMTVLVVVFFGCMLLHEVCNEALWERFDPPKAIALWITCFQFTVLALCSKLILLRNAAPAPAEPPLETPAPPWKIWMPYVGLSLLVFLSTGLSNHSVHYVQYPLKVMFKSSKLIPTMIVATVMRNNSKPFSLTDYLSALLLCAGTAGFATVGAKTSEGEKATQAMLYGCGLLTISVMADSFVPNAQQRIMKSVRPRYAPVYAVVRDEVWYLLLGGTDGSQGVSPEELMWKTNLCGLVLLVASMLLTDTMRPCVEFSLAQPLANVNLILSALTLFCAVYCMTRLLKMAGSVLTVAVATLRKTVTVVLSYLIFPKELRTQHVVSFAAVAAGLVLYEVTTQLKKRKEAASAPAQRARVAPPVDEEVAAR